MKRLIALVIGSAGGVGYLPRGGATVGTLLGAATFYALRPSYRTRLVMVAGATVAGQLASDTIASEHDHDPSYVIIDEIAGVWLALSPLPIEPARTAVGAALFRVLDRAKPSIVGAIDKRGGRYSVMGDDLVAGVLTATILIAGAALARPAR
jgi:phosphatidylglycerophosphatase A